MSITCLQVCELLDYGVDEYCAYLVMPKYQGSLRQWRLAQTAGLQENLGMYLNIFASVCEAVKVRHAVVLQRSIYVCAGGACLWPSRMACL